MTEILPKHYAVSEILLVAAAALAVARTWPLSRWFAAGLAVIGLAGLVAIIRILGELTGEAVVLHAFLSRTGSLFGLGCMAGALLHRGAVLPPVLGLAAAACALAVPAAAEAVFALVLVGGAAIAYRSAPRRKMLAAGAFAFLMVATLASMSLRASPALGWHVFHTLVAAWFVLVAVFVTGALPARTPAAPAAHPA